MANTAFITAGLPVKKDVGAPAANTAYITAGLGAAVPVTLSPNPVTMSMSLPAATIVMTLTPAAVAMPMVVPEVDVLMTLSPGAVAMPMVVPVVDILVTLSPNPVVLTMVIPAMSRILRARSNEIWTSYDSAATLYAFIYRQSDRYIWDVGDEAFEALGTWDDARADECDIVMTAVGDIHFANFPIIDAGTYYVQIRLQDGANPDTDDEPVAQGVVHWDGQDEIDWSTLTTDTRGILNIYERADA